MRQPISLIVFAIAASMLSCSAEVKPRKYDGRIAKRLFDTLPKVHVLQRVADDEISRRAWTNLITHYDFDHSVFLRSDLAFLDRKLTNLDDELKNGDAWFGYEVHNLFVTRLSERLAFATNYLNCGRFDFSENETYRVRRKDAPWPLTKEEAEIKE